MIKHTMQEIADFFGIYLAINISGEFCWSNSKMKICSTGWLPNGDDLNFSGIGNYNIVSPDYISDIHTHDWRVLVEPHTVDCDHAAHNRETGQCLGYASPECKDCVKHIGHDKAEFIDSLR